MLQCQCPDCGFQRIQFDDTISMYETQINHPSAIREILGPSRWIIVPKITDESVSNACERVLISRYWSGNDVVKRLEMIKEFDIEIQEFKCFSSRIAIIFETSERA